MPSLSVHLLIGTSLFILLYMYSRDLLSSFLCLVSSIIPDIDSLFGVHRSFISHNFLIPILLLTIAFLLYRFRKSKLCRIFYSLSIGYLSHLLFDIFTGYVAVLYPIIDACIQSKLVVVYNGKLLVSIYSLFMVARCSEIIPHIPTFSDKILITVLIFTLIVLAVVLNYHVKRVHSNTS